MYANEWIKASPVEDAQAAECEVRFTLTAGELNLGSSDLDTWLPANANYHFQVLNTGSNGGMAASIFIEIREVSSGIVQDSATFRIEANELIF